MEEILKKPHFLFKREIKVEKYLKGENLQNHRKEHQKKRIFVSNLPKELKDEDLRRFFSKFGEIETAYRVKIESEEKNTNYGYVTFQHTGSVNRVFKDAEMDQNGENAFFEIFNGKWILK